MARWWRAVAALAVEAAALVAAAMTAPGLGCRLWRGWVSDCVCGPAAAALGTQWHEDGLILCFIEDCLTALLCSAVGY